MELPLEKTSSLRTKCLELQIKFKITGGSSILQLLEIQNILQLLADYIKGLEIPQIQVYNTKFDDYRIFLNK